MLIEIEIRTDSNTCFIWINFIGTQVCLYQDNFLYCVCFLSLFNLTKNAKLPFVANFIFFSTYAYKEKTCKQRIFMRVLLLE